MLCLLDTKLDDFLDKTKDEQDSNLGWNSINENSEWLLKKNVKLNIRHLILIYSLVSRTGFEPVTKSLKGSCSTAELPAHLHNRTKNASYEQRMHIAGMIIPICGYY